MVERIEVLEKDITMLNNSVNKLVKVLAGNQTDKSIISRR
jgi:uncharacterized protein (UPF0335 family)